MKLEEKECSFFHNYIKGAHKGVPFKEGGEKKKKISISPTKIKQTKKPQQMKNQINQMASSTNLHHI